MGAVVQPQGSLAHGQAELAEGGEGGVRRRSGLAEGGVGLLVPVAADQDHDLGGRRGQGRGLLRSRASEEPGGEGQQEQPDQNGGPERRAEHGGHWRNGG